jgi:hypothetical protein
MKAKLVKKSLNEGIFNKKTSSGIQKLHKIVDDIQYNDYPTDFIRTGTELLTYAFNQFKWADKYFKEEGKDYYVDEKQFNKVFRQFKKLVEEAKLIDKESDPNWEPNWAKKEREKKEKLKAEGKWPPPEWYS